MAQRKIIWSLKASNDLLSILEFYFHRNGNSGYSQNLLSEIDTIVSLLPIHPHLGKSVTNAPYRVIIRGHYEIFYRFNSTTVIVITIWDSRQNPESKKL